MIRGIARFVKSRTDVVQSAKQEVSTAQGNISESDRIIAAVRIILDRMANEPLPVTGIRANGKHRA